MDGVVVSLRDLEFFLFEVLGADRLIGRARHGDHDRQSLQSILELTVKIADEVLWPNASAGDVEEPTLVDGQVRVPRAVQRSIAAVRDAGFLSAGLDEARGGMQLPAVVTQTCFGVLRAADAAAVGYLMLTRAAANLLGAYGSEEQKRLYMQPMYEGRYFGTMCLSEPDVGSSLGDIRSHAVPAGDGTYRIRGNKMWISGGDQDISENIVHLVLARLPDAPPGVKGISLFVVPKYRVNDDGSRGVANDIAVAGLNHKMGFRALSNCLLNFGENDACEAHLVGPPHGGLACMFHMMNEARIGVGVGATMLGYAGYRLSLRYARERRQGRPVDDKDPLSPPIAIIEHADVKRMLLKQKAYVEGGLLLCLTCAQLLDDMASGEGAAVKEHAEQLLDILTPIAKAWPAEYCLEANKLAIQVHGGYGYSRDFPVERLYRDNRLNAIHEGTNGIQAIDLLGRKVWLNAGGAFDALLTEIRTEADAADTKPALVEYAVALRDACVAIEAATAAIGTARANNRIADSLANATLYLHALGHIVIAWLWLRQARVAVAALAESDVAADSAFYRGKLAACGYFYRYELAQTGPMIDLLAQVDTTCLATDADVF